MGAVSVFVMGNYHHQPKSLKYLYRYNKGLHHSVAAVTSTTSEMQQAVLRFPLSLPIVTDK